MTVQVSELHHWLNQFHHPLLIEQWAQCQGVVKMDESNHSVAIELPFAVSHLEASLTQWISESDRPDSLKEYSFLVSSDVKALQSKVPSALTKVKNVIAVTSAKGGVGKSTTTANLALAITQLGAKVGVLDADIYGPSIPLMFGTQGQQMQVVDDKWMQPIEAYGVFTQSIGYLMSGDDAAVWRGPMASKALIQLLNETQWPELDYLIIDMPPGTGDLQITLAQQIPLAAAIIVTTPQDLALADAVKGIAMFDKVEVPVLGIVENMSYHECSQCGFQENIFGSGGAIKLAADKSIPVLGQLPLHINIRQDIDSGRPSVVNPTSSHQAKDYLSFAEQVVSRLFWQGTPKLESINFVELR